MDRQKDKQTTTGALGRRRKVPARRPWAGVLACAFAVMVVLFLAGCGGGGVSSPGAVAQAMRNNEPEPIELKVMTINLRHDSDWWEERFPLIADEIVRLQPDLIGMQEVEIGADQSDALLSLIADRDPDLSYEYHQQLKTGFDAFSGEGIAIFSRFPIIKEDFLVLSNGRVAIFDQVELQDGLVVDFCNTHLHHQGGDEVRLPQMQVIMDFIAERDESRLILFTGDMNSTPTSQAIQYAVDWGFADTFKAVHGDETETIGLTSPIILRKTPGEQNPRNRIDYVFLRAPQEGAVEITDSVVAFKNYREDGLYPSDHLGVMTYLRFSVE